MTSMAAWIAKKQGQPAPPPPQPQYQQPQPVYQQQYPPQQYQQPPQQYYPQQQPQGPILKPDGKLDMAALEASGMSVGQVARMWRGGEATRTENQQCPNCGDVLFSMHNTPSVINVNTGVTAYTPPYCATCGYRPGKHMQGDMANWATTA